MMVDTGLIVPMSPSVTELVTYQCSDLIAKKPLGFLFVWQQVACLSLDKWRTNVLY
jgi:hypothetical protein